MTLHAGAGLESEEAKDLLTVINLLTQRVTSDQAYVTPLKKPICAEVPIYL